MAHKKAASSSDNGRDSNSKRLGVKIFGGQTVKAGNIIVRQRGTKFHAGDNVYLGKDHTVHAAIEGTVKFTRGRKDRTYIHIVPFGAENTATQAPKAKKATQKKVVAPVAPKVEAPKAKVEAPKTEVEAPKVAAKSGEKIVLPNGKKVKMDDLTFVEGIGPKIAGLLNDAGVTTWAELGNTSVEKIKEVLAAAGSRYTMHNPGTWPRQAEMAAKGHWDALLKWQDILDGGVEPKSSEEE